MEMVAQQPPKPHGVVVQVVHGNRQIQPLQAPSFARSHVNGIGSKPLGCDRPASYTDFDHHHF